MRTNGPPVLTVADSASPATSRERELSRLARSVRGGVARAAIAELMAMHADLVPNVVNRYRRQGEALSALTRAGQAGLTEAITHYQPARDGGDLRSFAQGRIRWHVQLEVHRERQATPFRLRHGFRQLIQSREWLIANARRAAVQAGDPLTRRTLAVHLASRVGLDPEQTACLLAPGPVEPARADGISRLDHVRARRRLIVLAETVLGRRERVVFFARCLMRPEAAVPRERLARTLGATAAGIEMIERSARRKITIAAAVERLPDLLNA